MSENNKFEWEQFCRLGEAIGDGLHYEDPWISKEYKRLAKLLLPETQEEKDYKKKIRQQRNRSIDEQIAAKKDRCPKCQGELQQVRSGSRTVKCYGCGAKFQYKTKKK